MTEQKLSEYKNKLEKERAILLAEIKGAEKPTDFGSDVDEYDEEADEAEEFGNQLAVAQGLKGRLAEIDIAISKIHSKTYGVCEKCGKDIEEEILSIDPESRFCKSCKMGG